MTIPQNVNARWMATLADAQLVAAEAQLHRDFHKLETVEKRRSGARYMMLQGPSDLVNAWVKWLMVSNEARTRGLVVHRAR